MITRPFILLCLAISALSLQTVDAQKASPAAKQEATPSPQDVTDAKNAIAKGDMAYKDKKYDVAATAYRYACDNLPESPSTHVNRSRAVEGFSEASVRLAEQRVTEGRYADARDALRAVLDPQYNPDYKPAIALLAHVDDSEYFPAPLKDEDHAHWVQRLLIEAKGFYDTARFDLAIKRYDQILEIDPTNYAAKKGREDVESVKKKYSDNQNVSSQAWAPRRYGGDPRRIPPPTDANTEYIQNKLNRTILPLVKVREATVRDLLDFLHAKSIELDNTESDPLRKGVNMVVKLETAPVPDAPAPDDPASPVSVSDTRITLSLTNIPLAEALRYVCELAGLKYRVEPHAVVITPLSQPGGFSTHQYQVPKGFLTAGNGGLQSPQARLQAGGVKFPEGAEAKYDAIANTLTVRNSEENLALIDKLISNATPQDEKERTAGQSDAAVRLNDTNDTDHIRDRLDHTIIPRINFRDTPVREAIDYLRQKSNELNTTGTDQTRKGVDIITKLDSAPEAKAAPAAGAKITLSLTNVPLADALKYVAELADLSIEITPDSVILTPVSGSTGSDGTK